MNVSVVILTLNEEINIRECIASVSWSNDIVVLDSFSTDRTRAIAEESGARVYTREFDNYAAQRSSALTLCDLKNSWVLMLDADERCTPAFATEVLKRTAEAGPEVGLFRFRRHDILNGTWLKRSSGYPTWFGRLFRRDLVSIEREVNEEYHSRGTVELLDGHILHFPFSKGIDWWIARHNRYSTMEALRLIDERKVDTLSRATGGSLKDPTLRRRIAKQLFYRLPFRPFLMWTYLVLIRRGFLDGREGFQYAKLRFIYEHMIVIKQNWKTSD
jgi:glycosyltransferase involved in cell wall biosynthesis